MVGQIALVLESRIDRNGFFYDKNYISQLAQPSLDLLLQDICRNRLHLVVVFVSRGYEKSDRCGIEFRVIREIIMERDVKRIMFIRTDDDPVEGILKTDGYIDAPFHIAAELANHIQQRLDLADKDMPNINIHPTCVNIVVLLQEILRAGDDERKAF